MEDIRGSGSLRSDDERGHRDRQREDEHEHSTRSTTFGCLDCYGVNLFVDRDDDALPDYVAFNAFCPPTVSGCRLSDTPLRNPSSPTTTPTSDCRLGEAPVERGGSRRRRVERLPHVAHAESEDVGGIGHRQAGFLDQDVRLDFWANAEAVLQCLVGSNEDRTG